MVSSALLSSSLLRSGGTWAINHSGSFRYGSGRRGCWIFSRRGAGVLGRQLKFSLAIAAALAVAAPAAHGSTPHGDLVCPENENAQAASWDYWWGAGRLVTESGN